MNRPTTLLYRLLQNEAMQVDCAVERDIEYIRCRYQHEGMSFLTITLPLLSEVLEIGLKTGRVTPLMFHGFKPCKRGGRLPALLSGFFTRVFDSDGVLLDHPCIASIRAIRQISRLFKKVELDCSPIRKEKAYERYVSNDTGVYSFSSRHLNNCPIWTFVKGHLWSDLEDFSGELFCFPGIFGSGATSEKVAFNERHSITTWPNRSRNSFPMDYHATHRIDDRTVDNIEVLESSEEQPVRVVQVPKTLKTPRTISVEPSYMMLMQQSIAKPLMIYLENNPRTNPIRFTNQNVNRELARLGSIDGSLSTIDLSDASDLVSNDLVKNIFDVCPAFLDLIQDCRSRSAQMPDGSVVKLRKFASQGSALCFPIEAMVFYTIVSYSVLRQSGRRPSPNLLKELTASSSVYGDDIIVPTEMADGVMEDLEAFGLRVNHEKSFFTGFFRESCGGDYYKGHDVTPTYVRRWTTSIKDLREPQMIAANVSLSNQFYMKGLWNVTTYIRDTLTSLGQRIERSSVPVGGLTYSSVCFNTGLKWDSRRCSYSVRCPVLLPRKRRDRPRNLRGFMLRSFQRSVHAEACRELAGRLRSVRFKGELLRSDVDGTVFCSSPYPSFIRWVSREFYTNSSWTDSSERRKACEGNPHLELNRLAHLHINVDEADPLHVSVRPYTLKSKYRWIPTLVGLSF